MIAHARSLFGIAPGGACRAVPVAKDAVGSYPTVSPLLPQAEAVCSLWRFPSGFPGRALPGTVALWSPDFPRRFAPPRPSGSLRIRGCRGKGSAGQCAERHGNQAEGRSVRRSAILASSASGSPLAHGLKRARNAAIASGLSVS